MQDPLVEQYTLTCQHEGCGAKRIVQQVGSAGFTIGSMVLRSQADPDYGKCLRCQRYKMKVTEVPPPPEPLKPEGFTRVPTR
jgi:hypothetical protein